MTDVAWLTSSYPWAGDTVGGIFFRTQAQALARAGLDVTVVAPVPAVPWPLAHLSDRWRAHSLAPRVERRRPDRGRATAVPEPPRPAELGAARPLHRRCGLARARPLVGRPTDPRPLLARRARGVAPRAARRPPVRPDLPRKRHQHVAGSPPGAPGGPPDGRARGGCRCFAVSSALADRVRALTGRRGRPPADRHRPSRHRRRGAPRARGPSRARPAGPIALSSCSSAVSSGRRASGSSSRPCSNSAIRSSASWSAPGRRPASGPTTRAPAVGSSTPARGPTTRSCSSWRRPTSSSCRRTARASPRSSSRPARSACP